jgi:transposase
MASSELSNGPTEPTNLLIKKIKPVGHGFTNIRTYWLRLLFHCDVQWQTGHAARILTP